MKRILFNMFLVLSLLVLSSTSAFSQEIPELNYQISPKELESLQIHLEQAKRYNETLMIQFKKQKQELAQCQKDLKIYQNQIQDLQNQCKDLKTQLIQAKSYSNINEQNLKNANELLITYKKEVQQEIQELQNRETRVAKQRNILYGVSGCLLMCYLVK